MNWPSPAIFASPRRTPGFAQPEVSLGIPPGWGGTQRLPRLIGPGLAAEMIYTGRQVHAEEAHRIGLVNAVHPLDRLMPAAREMAARHRQEQPGRGPRGQESDWAHLHRRSRQRGWPPRWRASAPLSPRPTGARACAPLSRSGRPTSLATKAAMASGVIPRHLHEGSRQAGVYARGTTRFLACSE